MFCRVVTMVVGPTIRSADDDPFITPGGASSISDDKPSSSVAQHHSSSSNNGWTVAAGTDPASADAQPGGNGSVSGRAPPGLVPSSSPWLQRQPAFNSCLLYTSDAADE